MELLIVFIPFAGIIILNIIINRKKAVGIFAGDQIAHYAMIKTIEFNNYKIPIKYPRVPDNSNILVRGTRFYNWFLAILPKCIQTELFHSHRYYLLLISYSFYSCFYYIFQDKTENSLEMFLIFTLLYLFSPYQHNYQEARNSFSVRPVGELLISTIFLFYGLNKTVTLFAYLVFVLIFIIAIFISKFSRQVILFTSLPISIMNMDIFYFICVLAAFLFVFMFFKKARLSMQSQFYHLRYLWVELYRISVNRNIFPFRLKQLIKCKNVKCVIRTFPRTNVLIIFLDYPIVWLCVFNIVLSNRFEWSDTIVFSSIIIAFLTSIKKLRVFGEGKRYLDYISTYALFYALKNISKEHLIFVLIYSVLFSLFYYVINFYIKKKKQIRKMTKILKKW